MEKPMDHYWLMRLNEVKNALEGNNFQVHVVKNAQEAGDLVARELFPKTSAKTVSWGGSMTLVATGLVEHFQQLQGVEVIDTFEKGLSPEEMYERRRQALLTDLFITGSNAVTETGKLVNLDMYGNRVAAITFGPRNVIILVGRNKIVPDVEDAMMRVKDYAAPVNAIRLDKKTPCAKTTYCEDCKSPDRICNSWAITDKSFPKGRVQVVLINEDLGF